MAFLVHTWSTPFVIYKTQKVKNESVEPRPVEAQSVLSYIVGGLEPLSCSPPGLLQLRIAVQLRVPDFLSR